MLGISIYLGNQQIKNQEEYIRKMQQNGFQSIFTSLHIPEDNTTGHREQLEELGKLALELDMELIADISQDSLRSLGYNWSNAEQLVTWGVTGLRIDYGLDEATIIELSHKMNIALNASTISIDSLRRMKHNGLNIDVVEAWHNFYPRPETGIGMDDLIHQNKVLKEGGLSIMAFVPGDENLRAPLYEKLPTLEKHRNMSPFAGFLELDKRAHVDKILIGDTGLSESALEQFTCYQQNEILLRAIPYKEVEIEVIERVAGQHTNRPDNARDCLRSIESRQYATIGNGDITPVHCTDRSVGSITMDNEKYQRYQGEIQITKNNLPKDEKVNVIGRVISADIPLLQLIEGNQKFRIRWVE